MMVEAAFYWGTQGNPVHLAGGGASGRQAALTDEARQGCRAGPCQTRGRPAERMASLTAYEVMAMRQGMT